MKNCTVNIVKKAIDDNEKYVIVDVRTQGEFDRGSIKGAIHIPLDEITQSIEKMIPDKKTIVYVYCLSASRSCIAVEVMESLGYQNACNMENGLLAWRIAGYPLQ